MKYKFNTSIVQPFIYIRGPTSYNILFYYTLLIHWFYLEMVTWFFSCIMYKSMYSIYWVIHTSMSGCWCENAHDMGLCFPTNSSIFLYNPNTHYINTIYVYSYIYIYITNYHCRFVLDIVFGYKTMYIL